jgi:hypothetical protein
MPKPGAIIRNSAGEPRHCGLNVSPSSQLLAETRFKNDYRGASARFRNVQAAFSNVNLAVLLRLPDAQRQCQHGKDECCATQRP